MAEAKAADFDLIAVGAGFAGLGLIHYAREAGLSIRVFDKASDIGGTWTWNRYPGAASDSECYYYCLTFSKEQLRFNRLVADELAQATYDGIWFSALHRDLRQADVRLRLVAAEMDDGDRAAYHAAQHARYKPDDNARDRAIARARQRYPEANRAAEPLVIYWLDSPSASSALRRPRHD